MNIMNLGLLIVIISLALAPMTSLAKNSDLPAELKPKIVGGEIANQGDWPWMSALVFVGNQVNTSLTVAGNSVDTNPLTFGPSGQVTASIVNCGIADTACIAAADKICLIARGEINFSVKVDNCQAGGGLGAIIFNNTAGNFDGTLGENFSGNIPVVAISQTDGQTLLQQLDNIAILSVSEQTTSVQNSTCGASFLGDKWVLTAAHCVEDVNVNSLRVNVGEYDLSDGAENATKINSIFIHPDYNQGAFFNNDIALIELAESLNIPAVTLADANMTSNLASMASYATVIGWGNQIAYGPDDAQPTGSQPNKLYQVELSLLTNEQCRNQLIATYQDLNGLTYSTEDLGITSKMICANYPQGGKGSCQGDSGGPLIVNTNEGLQQVGIVSFGTGCADGRFPDVYARVGEFTQWIKSITGGIAITPSHEFFATPQGVPQSTFLTVTNNSAMLANLTFTLEYEAENYQGISLQTEDCTLLAANSSCEIEVTFDASQAGKQQATIMIETNNKNIPAATSFVSAEALTENSDINLQLPSNTSNLKWYSGGDLIWQLDTTQAAITSGSIVDDQTSSALLTFSGPGSLSFEWAVSSEQNLDDPDEPFDALYLYINGQLYDFISGEVSYTVVNLPEFAEGEHQVLWVYAKDPAVSAGDDKGYLKNVNFIAALPEEPEEAEPEIPAPITTPVTSPSTPAATPITNTPSSGGSSNVVILLTLLLVISARRISVKH